MQNKFDAVTEYHRQELKVIPLKAGSKIPALKPAYDRPFLSLQECENYFYNTDFNIGVECGRASKGFFVIDFDDRSLSKKYKSEINAFRKIGAPVVETKRGFHIWTRCPEAVGRAFEKVDKIDFKNSGHVVVPPSIIPFNEEQQLKLFSYSFREDLKQIPEIKLEQIPFKSRERITPGTDLIRTESGILIPYDERPHGIPMRLFQALDGIKGEYPSRSEADQALITYCVNNGWTAENIIYLFEVHATKETKFKEKGNHGYSYLKTCYSNAVEYLTNNRTAIDRQIDALTLWTENKENWTGRTALTDQAVFQAFLQIARRTGKVSDIYASIREIAEAAGIEYKTASKALDRIPFLKLLRKDIDCFKPAVWSIETPKHMIRNATKRHIPTHSPCIKGLELNHDLFRIKAIGKNGRLILTGLDFKEWRSLSELVVLTNINRRTIERKISKMEYAGLIEIKGQLYNRLFRRIENADLNKAAEILGTAGTLKRQKAKHKIERGAYRKAFETKESLIAG